MSSQTFIKLSTESFSNEIMQYLRENTVIEKDIGSFIDKFRKELPSPIEDIQKFEFDTKDNTLKVSYKENSLSERVVLNIGNFTENEKKCRKCSSDSLKIYIKNDEVHAECKECNHIYKESIKK